MSDELNNPTKHEDRAEAGIESASLLSECFECEKGRYEEKMLGYKTTDVFGTAFFVRDVPHLICNKCGDCSFTMEACEMIERERVKRGVIYKR